MFFLLYKNTNNGVFDDFPKIFDHFPKIPKDFCVAYTKCIATLWLIYLFVHESRAPVTRSSVVAILVVNVVSSNFFRWLFRKKVLLPEANTPGLDSVCDTCRLQTCRLADLQTCRLADLQTCRLADLQTCRLADLQTCRLVDLQTWRVGTPEVFTQNHF